MAFIDDLSLLFFFSTQEIPSAKVQRNKKFKCKTSVINDPLGQSLSFASSDHYSRLNFIWKVWTDGQKTCGKTMITTGRDRVGRVDQEIENLNSEFNKV